MQIKKGDIFLLESYEGKDWPKYIGLHKVKSIKNGNVYFKAIKKVQGDSCVHEDGHDTIEDVLNRKDYPTRLRYTKVNHHNTKLGKILYK